MAAWEASRVAVPTAGLEASSWSGDRKGGRETLAATLVRVERVLALGPLEVRSDTS